MRRIAALMIRVSGSHAPAARRQLRAIAVNAALQAAAYALLVPLVIAVVSPEGPGTEAWVLLGAFSALLLIEEATGVRALEFAYEQFPAVTGELRLRVGEQLRTMPAEELQHQHAGDLAELLGGTVVKAVMGISTVSAHVLQLMLVPAAVLLVVLAADWRLGLVLLVAVPFGIPLVRRIQGAWNQGYRSVSAADAQTSSRVVEYVQGLAVFKASGQVGARAQRLQQALAHQDHAMSTSFRRLESPALVAGTLAQLAIVALVGVGAALVLRGDIAVATVLALVAISVRFAEPVAAVMVMTGLFEATEVGLSQIDELLSVAPLPAPTTPRRPDRYDIAFEAVGFAYAGKQDDALDGVTFRVPAGSLTALVGPSGSGKTTIARLVMRYADPQRGSVTIGGVDVRDIEQAELASLLTAVFQDVYLFDDTIATNIRLGRPDATDDEVIAAARSAHCHDFITALPRGYETGLGELGASLSGGERQRLSIARAILKNAPIVLLDEPTAALDSESERSVQQAIDALVSDHTIVVIAHRLSMVVAADQILVVEHGQIIQHGTHAQLIAIDGRYAAMWASQQQAGRWRLPRSS